MIAVRTNCSAFTGLVLVSLSAGDSAGRQVSKTTGEWMYVFKPRIGEEFVYVKLIVRSLSAIPLGGPRTSTKAVHCKVVRD